MYLKIFIFLIIFQPILAITWDWKFTEYNISPLQVYGVLLFLFLTAGIGFGIRKRNFKFNTADKIFGGWTILVLLNSLLFILNYPSVETGGHIIKLLLPPALYFFIRYYVVTKEDWIKVLKGYTLACLIPFLMILYEIVIQPIDPYVPGGRLMERFRGFYADGVSYIIYFEILFTGTAYFFLRRKPGIRDLIFITSLSIILLITQLYVVQLTSYILFAYLFIIASLFVVMKTGWKGVILPVLLILLALIIFGSQFDKRIDSMTVWDKKALRGEAETSVMMNSRFGIWESKLEEFSSLSYPAMIFGSGFDDTGYGNTGNATHNDLIRLLFVSGITGVILYISFFIILMLNLKNGTFQYKFIFLAALGSLLILSIPMTPSNYYWYFGWILLVLSHLSLVGSQPLQD